MHKEFVLRPVRHYMEKLHEMNRDKICIRINQDDEIVLVVLEPTLSLSTLVGP